MIWAIRPEKGAHSAYVKIIDVEPGEIHERVSGCFISLKDLIKGKALLKACNWYCIQRCSKQRVSQICNQAQVLVESLQKPYDTTGKR